MQDTIFMQRWHSQTEGYVGLQFQTMRPAGCLVEISHNTQLYLMT